MFLLLIQITTGFIVQKTIQNFLALAKQKGNSTNGRVGGRECRDEVRPSSEVKAADWSLWYTREAFLRSPQDFLRDKERQDLGQATHTIEVKRTLTIEEVKRELAEMKRGAIDAEVE